MDVPILKDKNDDRLLILFFVCGQLLLGSGVGTVRLYDTDAKKNLYEMNIDETHPR